MTREQRWLRAELQLCLDAIRDHHRGAKGEAAGSERQLRHSKARAETLRRILAIVERAQGA